MSTVQDKLIGDHMILLGTIISIDMVCGLENPQQKGCRSDFACYAVGHPLTSPDMPCNGHSLTDNMHAEWAGNAG